MSTQSKSTWDGFSGTSPTANLFSSTATLTQNQKSNNNDNTEIKMATVPKIYELDYVKKTIVLDELAIKAN